MLEVSAALDLILQQTAPLAAQRLPVAKTLGQVLAEDVAADVDSPPHDKAMMDGVAVAAGDLGQADAELQVLETITAGDTPQTALEPGACVRIMTGAPIPPGTAAVVMREQVAELPNGRVRVALTNTTAGKHIMRRGASMHCGEVILPRGTCLRPLEVGLLSEVGRAQVMVVGRPQVAVLATGNELVPADEQPSPGMIRNTNGPMLLAAATAAGAAPHDLGIGRDDREQLAERIAEGLQRDILLLSGGVSAGVLDLVPGVLQQLGVRQVFHKVRLKPGKPLWFGVSQHAEGQTLVFGLPGNPVSALVCFRLFVQPALQRLAGQAVASESKPLEMLRLSEPYEHSSERSVYWPARRRGTMVELLAWHGSADLRHFSAADCLAVLPAGERRYSQGELVEVLDLG